MSKSGNAVNARYDASYSNSENLKSCLDEVTKSLSLGQACGIIAVALYGPDFPAEDAGNVLHISHISYINKIVHHRISFVQAMRNACSSSNRLLCNALMKMSWTRFYIVNLNPCCGLTDAYLAGLSCCHVLHTASY